GCGKVQEPRGDHTAAPPHLGDVTQVEVVLVVLRFAQRCCLGIDLVGAFPDVGISQDTQALGVSSHDAVFDAVVYHLDEVACTVRAAVQVTLLGGTADFLETRGAGNFIAPTWGECRKNRVDVLYHIRLAANHHAVAALQPPDPA